jgi:hypothetical protein
VVFFDSYIAIDIRLLLFPQALSIFASCNHLSRDTKGTTPFFMDVVFDGRAQQLTKGGG